MDFSFDMWALGKVVMAYTVLGIAAVVIAVVFRPDTVYAEGILWSIVSLPFSFPPPFVPSMLMIAMGLRAPKAWPLVLVGALGVVLWVAVGVVLVIGSAA